MEDWLHSVLNAHIHQPFDSENIVKTMNFIKFGVYSVSDGLPPDAMELLSHKFENDTEKRFTIEEISPSDCASSDIDMPVTPARRVITIDSVLTTVVNAWSIIQGDRAP